MSAPAHHCFGALVALSDNPLSVEVRRRLLAMLSDDNLGSINKSCIETASNHAERGDATAALLDIAAKRAKTKEKDTRAEINDNASEKPVLQDQPRKRARQSIYGAISPEQSTEKHTIVDLRSDEEEESFQRGKQVTSVKEARNNCSMEELAEIQKVLCVPNKFGNMTWEPLTEVSHELKQQLLEKFDTQYLSTDGHRYSYRAMLNNQFRHFKHGRCVNNVVYAKCGVLSTWARSDGNKDRACDVCINKKRLCAKVIPSHGETMLAFCPLPNNLRPAMEWHELAYWILVLSLRSTSKR
jgi:hypothetical protein